MAAVVGLSALSMPAAAGVAYRTLYSFAGSPDGQNPAGGLLFVNGMLLGTTVYGGTGTGVNFACENEYVPGGCGTVFRISPSGVERPFYNFLGTGDGAFPQGNLIDGNGVLYGTSEYGGIYGNTYDGSGPPFDSNGTVYRLSATGVETTIHSFGEPGLGDGRLPAAGLLDLNGTLYGTTSGGGAHFDGTVFAVDPSGAFRTVYSFGASNSDGMYPTASLIAINGELFGTTLNGGSAGCSLGCGTVFEVSPAGKETIL